MVSVVAPSVILIEPLLCCSLEDGRPHTRAKSQPFRSGQQQQMPNTILSPLKAAKVSSTIVAAHNKDKETVSTKRTSRNTTAVTKRYIAQLYVSLLVNCENNSDFSYRHHLKAHNCRICFLVNAVNVNSFQFSELVQK